jgi:holin-like protein
VLVGFATLVGFQLLGEIVARGSGLPVPGTVIGMFLLFVALAVRGKVPASLQKTSSSLLGVLPLLFVPATTGALLRWREVAGDALPVAVGVVASTWLAMAVTGLVFSRLIRDKEKTP